MTSIVALYIQTLAQLVGYQAENRTLTSVAYTVHCCPGSKISDNSEFGFVRAGRCCRFPAYGFDAGMMLVGGPRVQLVLDGEIKGLINWLGHNSSQICLSRDRPG